MASDINNLQRLICGGITATPGAAGTFRGAALSGVIRGD
jgi:hypothetical protein